MKDLTTGKIWKNLLLYAVPVIFSLTLSRAYTAIDKIMVGKLLGDVSLAAIGSTNSFTTFFSSLLWGAAAGIPLYIGYLASKNENAKTINALKTNVIFLALIAFIVSILSIVFIKPIFRFLKVNDQIYEQARNYYVIIMGLKTMYAVNVCLNDLFNILGMPSKALKNSIINCLINITLNYVFIKIFGWGVTGAAIATFISIAAVFVINLLALKKLIRSLLTEKVPYNFEFTFVKSAWKYALPCMVQQGAMYFASVIIQPVINGLGNYQIAAYSVDLEIYNILTIFFYGASSSVSTFSNQCYGKGKIHLVKKGLRSGLLIGFGLSLPVIILSIVFPTALSSLFLQDASGQTSEFVVRYIVLCFPFLPLAIFTNFFHRFFRGIMAPNFALISTVVYSVARIAATYALASFYLLDGVYFGFIIAWAVEFFTCLILYFSGKWKTKQYREMEKNLQQSA